MNARQFEVVRLSFYNQVKPVIIIFFFINLPGKNSLGCFGCLRGYLYIYIYAWVYILCIYSNEIKIIILKLKKNKQLSCEGERSQPNCYSTVLH